MHFKSAELVLFMICSTTSFNFAMAQPLPPGLKTWTLEYSLTGGLAGLDRHLRLTDAGDLSVGNSEGRGSHVATHAAAELMTKVAEFLKVARKEGPASGGPIADAIHRSLILTSVGPKYELQAPDGIASLLEKAMDRALEEAFIGTWWQSAWKLCRPAPQLTTSDVDPPIESLVFQSDGRFMVTWRGGGAHTTMAPTRAGFPGSPHAFLPDYSGRYRIEPAYNYIQMRFDSGIYTPRDFAGNGRFEISGDKLSLQNVWLGTYKAKQKPDVCELTFTRK